MEALFAGSTPDATVSITARPADSASKEGGTSTEKGTAGRVDLSTAYDEPRSSFHAACPFDCPWHAENVPRGDFFRTEGRP